MAVACTGSTEPENQDTQPRLVFGTATARPDEVSLGEIRAAAGQGELDLGQFNSFDKTDEGLYISLISPKRLEVGAFGRVTILVANISANYRPEAPFNISQTSAQIIPGGPITVIPSNIQQSFVLPPSGSEVGTVDVTCTDVGPASVTFQSVGMSEIEDPATAYSTTSEANFECVADDDNPLTHSRFSKLTDDALGFSANTLTWVTFEQDGVILRVNQIEPVELAVGASVEIYADFDARETFRLTESGAELTLLTDGELDFTSGGPVSIDSPPQRVAEPLIVRSVGTQNVYWGFRSGTLACDSVGEGVYHANLRGKRFTGEDVLQTVSGLVDCVEPADDAKTAIADALDFSGVWSRRPSPDSYKPTARDAFPGNTELYFDRQLCVARIQGIRACDVAYWAYGTDWLELTKQGDTQKTVDQKGNEVFVTEYTGTIHHTHSYLQETKIPDDLLRDGKTWGTAWDLATGLTNSTFEISGTVTFSPHLSNSVQISLQGTYQGEMPYTHTSKVGMGYSGPIPESGLLPVGMLFSEEVRQQLHSPEGMFRGSDQAYKGAFYSAAMQTNGVVAGTVRPASAAERIDQATVSIYLPGEEAPFATSSIDAAGRFTFTGLSVIRTDDSTTGEPDVFASQYKVTVTDAASEVDGNTLLFQPRTVAVRPFTDRAILLEPAPATHFIAVGDRGVGGAPIVFHYSLEYWTCGGRFDPLHHVDGFTPEEIVSKCRELDPRARPQKLGAVELLARTDWEVWAGVDDLVGSGRSWLKQGVWIAEIVYEGISATELMPIFAGTEGEIEAKWAEIIDLAENYLWAEQAGFAEENAFTQWPLSMYDPLGTNSNTFIRFLVMASGLRMTEMDGSHPGHPIPVQNTESDLGRLLTFYPEHPPWTGTPETPEPSGTPQ